MPEWLEHHVDAERRISDLVAQEMMDSAAIADFVEAVVERGIEAARRGYREDPDRLEGAIAGFESCREKSVDEILVAYQDANAEANRIQRIGEIDEYWRARCKALEIEWTLNCLSVVLHQPLLSWLPTARATMLVGEILGVTGPDPIHNSGGILPRSSRGPNQAEKDE